MKMCKNMLFVIFLLGFSFSWGYLPEEGNVTANVGPYFFKTNFKEASTKAGAPLMPGIGLIVNGDVSDHGSLEVAMFHLNKRYLRTDGDFSISELSQVIHITMGYKWWLSRYLSTSLALYSAYPMGNVRVVHNNFPTGTELPTSARDTTEYGFDLALQTQVWRGEKFDVVSEARYSISVTSRDHEEADHYGVFLGLRYLVQEKNPQKPTEEDKKNKIKK